MDKTNWILYGATGYSGEKIAELAVSRGMRPILAGRSSDALQALATRLDLEHRIFPLDKTAQAIDEGISGVTAVLNAAGPFEFTCAPLVEACLRTHTHYLDISGEIGGLEYCAAQDARARAAGIAIMPALGFDLVPSDCLAIYLKKNLPAASDIQLGISFAGSLSIGSLKSGLLMMPAGTLVRRDDTIVRLDEPLARTFDFGDGPEQCFALSMGDISLLGHTSSFRDVTVFLKMTTAVEQMSVAADLPEKLDEATLDNLVHGARAGPSQEELDNVGGIIVAEARSPIGEVISARMNLPNCYKLTFDIATTVAGRFSDGLKCSGFTSAGEQFGADFILEFADCTRIMIRNI